MNKYYDILLNSVKMVLSAPVDCIMMMFVWRLRAKVITPLSHWKFISKLFSKFMLISSFRKKISSVNSPLSKEINFEILFHNLERVLFCKISQTKFQLRSTLIGQSASVYKHQTKRRLCRRCWLSKVYFQCESAYF